MRQTALGMRFRAYTMHLCMRSRARSTRRRCKMPAKRNRKFPTSPDITFQLKEGHRESPRHPPPPPVCLPVVIHPIIRQETNPLDSMGFMNDPDNRLQSRTSSKVDILHGALRVAGWPAFRIQFDASYDSSIPFAAVRSTQSAVRDILYYK